MRVTFNNINHSFTQVQRWTRSWINVFVAKTRKQTDNKQYLPHTYHVTRYIKYLSYKSHLFRINYLVNQHKVNMLTEYKLRRGWETSID